VDVDYLLPDGQVVARTYRVAAHSRYTIWIDQARPVARRHGRVHPAACDVPVIVERAMWWRARR